MAPKSSSDNKAHLGPEDFNEGPQAAARFLAAASKLFKAPTHAKPKPKTPRKSRK